LRLLRKQGGERGGREEVFLYGLLLRFAVYGNGYDFATPHVIASEAKQSGEKQIVFSNIFEN
jgi:hypothetical protein